MKTKFLLGALTLPMFFAACTSEELMENSVNANLQNRIPLGEVTLDLGNADSRLALQDGSFNTLTWSNGDDLGASLIDVVGTVNSDPESLVDIINQYNLTTTPQTNYRYEYNNGSWTSNAAMVEGNYVFYMPYVENTSRVAPLAVLPTVQNLEQVTINGENAYTTYNDVLENAKENGNIMAVAYKFLSAEGENNDGNKTISINFKQLYATPLISIQNYARDNDNNLTDLTIKQILLEKVGGSFIVKDRINFGTSGNTATAEAWGSNGSIVNSLNTVLNPTDATYKGGAWAVGANQVAKSTSDVLTGVYTEVGNTHLSTKITINVEEPITIASEEIFSFYAVIPGGDYTTQQLKVTLITTENKAVDVVLPAVMINPGKRYAVQGYDNEGNVDAGATALLAVTTKQLVDAPSNEPEGVAIATQAELYAAIATAQKVDDDDDPQTAAVPVALQFVPAEGIVLNDQVINMLNDKATEIASVKFNGDMTVSGLTKTTTVPVSINGKAVMSNTVVTTIAQNGAASTIGINGAITVAEGAEVKLTGTAMGAITNNGTLTIAGATTANENITNNSVLNLSANLTLVAGKNLTNSADATINSVVASTLTANKVVNRGTVTVATANLSVTSAIDNYGIINSSKTLAVTGAVVNKEDAELNVLAAATTVTGVFTNEGVANVSENATLTASTANSTNKNEINNAGILNIDMNIGTINVTNSSKFGTSLTTVTKKFTNAQNVDVWGNIYNPYAKEINVTTLTASVCQYVWNSEEAYTGIITLNGTDGTYNAIKFNDATVNASAATGLIYVEFNGQSTLNPSADLNIDEVKVNATELEITGTSELTTELTVAADAVVGWNSAITLSGNVYNYGKIYGNDGTVSATCYGTASQYLGTAFSAITINPLP